MYPPPHMTHVSSSYDMHVSCMSYEEEDTCMSYEEEDTTMIKSVNSWPEVSCIVLVTNVNYIVTNVN
jgi:hypothetical protein